jgi:hypothetical protein
MRNILLIIATTFAISVNGQALKIEEKVKSYFDKSYISDGQIYRVMLNEDEEGEFEVTFFSGTRYRVAISSTLPNSDINYSITDSNRNIIFNNEEFDNSPYWDFVFTSTFDCNVIVKLNNEQVKSGIVIMMIGYKNSGEK